MTIYDTNCEYCNQHYVTGDDLTVEDSGLCNKCENNDKLYYNDETYKWEEN